MYCKKCGTEAEGTLVYCKKCGALLIDAEDFDDPLLEFEQKVDNLFEEFELRRREFTQAKNSQSFASGVSDIFSNTKSKKDSTRLSPIEKISYRDEKLTLGERGFIKEDPVKEVLFDWNIEKKI